MHSIVIACNTIADEFKYVMREVQSINPVIWIESGLHKYPDKLKDSLQEQLDKISGVDRVLLGFGLCGNAICGLKARDFSIIVPRVDDCISLLIGSMEIRKNYSDRGTYFLTKGWLDHEMNIWEEYKYTVNKYGKELADSIYKRLLNNYKNLCLIDNGTFNAKELSKTTKFIADKLGLIHDIIPGNLNYIKKLLEGPYDNDFIEIKANSEVPYILLS